MAFTMTELRQELQGLGYGDLSDEFIVSSLSQLQLHVIPDSSKEGDKDRSYTGRVHAKWKPPSQQVHGSPVPGDRDFVPVSMRSAFHKKEAGSSATRRGGMDSVCFTPDFATEVDEMRKMLRIMHGTKENLFGSGSGGSRPSYTNQRTIRKPVGLADEHQVYVGNLWDQWRVVGRTLRSKRKDHCPVEVGNALPSESNNASNSENRNHRPKQTARIESEFRSPAEEPSTTLEKLERSDAPAHRQECLTATREFENGSKEGVLNAIQNSGAGLGGVGVTEKCTTGPAFQRQESSSAISPESSYQPGGMLYPENFTADVYHKGRSDDLLRTDEEVTLLPSHQDVAEDGNPSPSSPRSSARTPKEVLDEVSSLSKDQFLDAFQKSLDDPDPKDAIDQETFANVNQRISDTTTSPHNDNNNRLIPVESENPFDLSVPALRTPDRRGGGRPGYQSPLNDRSNMRFAEEDPEVSHYSHSAKPNKKKEWDSSVTAAAKRNSAVILKRSRSSRSVSKRNEIVEEAPIAEDTPISGDAEGQQAVNPATTPPSSSARKFKSLDKALRHSMLEKSDKCSISPRITVRNKGNASDAASPSALDIPSLGLSPIKIREQSASPLSLSHRERACAANGYYEHRSCSVCNPTSLRKSGDSNNSQSSTTGSKHSETVVGESEASPQHKRSSVRTETAGSSLKQKLPLKNSAAPSGIYTPLDPKKNELSSSKVLLKTRRIASSMDFASDSSRLAIDRRAPSLRSSTESSRSSGPHRATSSQSQVSKSNSGSSPYAKSSTFSSFSSRSATPKDILTSPFDKSSSIGSRSSATPKGTLTPGGPRRGGKVDRVARFAEMQNLWKNDKFLKASSKRKPQSFHRIFARLHLSHERCTAAYRERVLEDTRPRTAAPPFEVPTINSNSERVYIF